MKKNKTGISKENNPAPSSASPVRYDKSPEVWRIVLIILISVGVLALESIAPLGYVVWLIYLFPLYLTFWITRWNLHWILALAYTVFISLFFFQGPAVIPALPIIFNRLLGIILLWGTAFLLAKRRKTEAALQRSREEAEKGRGMLEGLLTYIPLAIQILDNKQRILRVSAYSEQLTGYPSGQLEGKTLAERHRLMSFYHPDGVTPAGLEELPAARVLRTGEVVRNEEWKIKTAQGKSFDISIDTGPLKNIQGQMTGAVVAWHDVTAYKKAIAGLHEAEERERRERELLQTIINVIPVMITVYDREINELYLNKFLTQVTGWTNDDSKRMNLMEAIYPDPDYRQMVIDYMQSLAPGFRDLVMMTKDGQPLDASWANVQLPDGRQVGIGLDIRERKRAEEAIRRSEEQLKAVFEAVADGITVFDTTGKIILINEAEAHINGYPSAAAMQRDLAYFAEVYELMYPDGRLVPVADWPVSRVLRGEAIKDWELRGRRKDIGREWFFSFSGEPVFDRQRQQLLAVVITRDITARKEAEENLRKSKEFTESVLSSSLTGLYIFDWQKQAVTFINQQYTRLTGYTLAELDALIKAGTFLDFFHPEDRARVTDYVRQMATLKENEVREIEYRFKHKDGSWRWLFSRETLFSRFPDGSLHEYLGSFLDISERKEIEFALKESELKFRTLSENSPDVIARFDRKLRHTYINPFGARVYGWPQDQVIGKTNAELGMPSEKVAFWKEYFHKVFTTGEQQIVEFDFDSPQLGHMFFQSYLVPEKDEQGRVSSILAITRDITNLKEYQGKLEQSNRELEQFAYVASHDLQEPLRIVASFTELLERRYKERLDAKGRGYIQRIVDGANRMQRLIQDLLTFSRVGRIDTARSPVDMNEIVDRVIGNLGQLIRETGAAVTRDPLPRLSANETSLTQLFQNLIGNAIKFRRQGVPPRVHVSVQKTDREWLFAVQDNGIGIDPKYFDKLFVIFQRLHPVGEYPGTGIGLAIAKKIVDTYGGRIWVSSRPGEGSTFHFTLPQSG